MTEQTHLDRLNASFKQIMQAANDTKHQTLCAHIWEWMPEDREREISTVLRVMSGDDGAVYHDDYREQSGNANHGMIGLSTTAICTKAAIELFNPMGRNDNRVGVLLLNATPAFVYNDDAFSLYGSSEYGKTIRVGLTKELRPSQDPSHTRYRHALSDFLAARQGVKSEEESLIDPTDVSQIKKAKDAYAFMMEHYPDWGGVVHPYNEVIVNTKLEHVAGVIIRHKAKAMKANLPWSEQLIEDSQLTKALVEAVTQIDMIKQQFADSHLAQEPTIVIYQPEGRERFVHFPPTRQNRQMLEAIAKKQGIQPNESAAASGRG